MVLYNIFRGISHFVLHYLYASTTPKQKGIEGENVISNIIQYAPMYKKIVRNAYIDMNENKKTEIDIIAISTKGIYVIESKNY